MDHFRSRRRWQPEEEVPEPAGQVESSAEDEALRVLSSESMFDLIEELSDEQRQVLILKFVFDFSNVEAAAVLEKTEGAVKSLQHRALASLQKHVSS
jgi:RNA polymerase sigma-70 factor (ECF subfamily)